MPASVLDAGPARRPASPRPRAASSTGGDRPRQGRQADRRRAARRPHRLGAATTSASSSFDVRRGPPPRDRRRGRDRQVDRRPRGLQGRRPDPRRRPARPSRRYRLVGHRRDRAASTRSAARPSPMLTLPEAQRITGKVGEFDEIDVAADDGRRRPAQLKRELHRRRSGDTCTCAPARSRPSQLARTSATTSASCSTALLAFAGISLFVGAFIIFNTFSITVAQRTREFALLRTLGASRAPGPALGARRGPGPRRRSARWSGSGSGIVAGAGAARAVQGGRRRPAVATARSSSRGRSSSRCSSASS